MVQGWLVALVIFGASSIFVERWFGSTAGIWFFIGAATVIVCSMFAVGFTKKKKEDG